MHRPIFSLLLLSAIFVASRAVAGDPAAAQALFDSAKKHMVEGNYTQACHEFEDSQNHDAGLGTQFQLANCWQHLGRTASAWSLFREVESGAHAIGQNGRERVAHDRAAALEPRLSKIAFSLPDDMALASAADPESLEIRRDGIPIGREALRQPVPVDPGEQQLVVVARGKRPWQTTVSVPADGKTITVRVPSLTELASVAATAAAAPHAAGVAPAADQPKAPPPAPRPPARGVASVMPGSFAEEPIVENRGGVQRAVGWFFAGAGVVGLGAGGYFGGKWISDRDRSDSHCGGGSCDATGTQLRSDARTMGTDAIVSASAGAGAVLLGVALVVTAPRSQVVDPPRASAIRVVPRAGPTEAALDVLGSF